MAATKSGVTLVEGEELIAELEAELWATSSNPIARFLGAIQKFIAMILGSRKKGFLVITNKRVVEVSTQIACYCMVVGRQIKYVLPSSIKEIGYTRAATFLCCCPAYHLYYESFTQRTAILLKGADEAEALKLTDAFYAAISYANK